MRRGEGVASPSVATTDSANAIAQAATSINTMVRSCICMVGCTVHTPNVSRGGRLSVERRKTISGEEE